MVKNHYKSALKGGKLIWIYPPLKVLLIILTSLLFFTAYPQYDSLRFKMLENGILHKLDISGIYFTRDGKTWFGTTEGLASFDGNDFKVYPTSQSQKDDIINDRILAFAEDKKGGIWIITVQRKLARFDPKTGKYFMTNFLKNDSLQQDTWIPKIYADNNNKLWLGSNNGFFIYEITTGNYEHYNLQPNNPETWKDRYKNSVRDFAEDPTNKDIMWLGAYGSGILSFNKKTKVISRRFNAANIKDSVKQDGYITGINIKDTVIWFGTWSCGVGKYNINTGKYYMYPRNQKMFTGVYPHGHVVRSLVPKSDHEYYVALYDSVPAIFNTRTLKYVYINDAQLERTVHRTSALEKDVAGNVWCLKGGRLYFTSPAFQVFKTLHVPLHQNKPFSAGHTLRKVIWDNKRQVYYAAINEGEGVYVYNKSFNFLKLIPLPGLPVHENLSVVWEMEMDKTGRLWVLGDELLVYDSAVNKMVSAKEKYKAVKPFTKAMSSIAIDVNGNLVMQSAEKKLIFLNVISFAWSEISLPKTKAPAYDVNSRGIRIDNKRNYIYTSDGNAIFQYRVKEGIFNKIEFNPTVANSLPRVNVSNYILDFEGNLWVGTRGIYIYEPSSLRIIKILSTSNGLTDNVNINLLQGPPGFIFFFSSKGGNMYSLRDSTFAQFDLNNGLKSDFPRGYSYANNHLFFSSGNGNLGNFYAPTSAIWSLQTSVVPYISAVQVVNNDFKSDTIPQFLSGIQLQSNQNSISFSMSSIEFAFPEKVEYAYQLENVDNDWTVRDYINRTVTYTNLKPGTYVFKVKARMLGGKWSQAKPLYLSIIPAFWQTWWFTLLCLLAAVAIIYYFISQRISSIRLRETLRTKHERQLIALEAQALRAQMNPHFIFNCLNSIKALIQRNENDTAAKYLTTFSKLIRTLFENSGKREVSLHEEIETCKLYTQLEALRFKDKVSFDFEVDELIDMKDIKVPALILQPLIENAIWHGLVPQSTGGHVTISVQQTKEGIQCIVDDDGIGRQLSKQYNADYDTGHESKGISLTKTRLNIDRILSNRDEDIEIHDKKDKAGRATGTTAILTFKIAKE